MRYSTRTLLVLISLLAITVAVSRAAWLRWPAGTLSFGIGIGVWVGILITAGSVLAGDRSRQRSRSWQRGWMGIASGVLWMLGFWLSPQLLGLFLGFLFGGTMTLAAVQLGPPLLSWAGVESR